MGRACSDNFLRANCVSRQSFPEELPALERASKVPQRNFQNSCNALRNKMEFMRSMIDKKPPEWRVRCRDEATTVVLCVYFSPVF